MKTHSSKLQHQQKEQTVETQRTAQQAAAREFGSVEEVLRFNAAQTPVPESVKSRLADSVRKEPAPERPRSWWRRLLP
jgi:mannitol-1-phosphate/altronate dehydrogenase